MAAPPRIRLSAESSPDAPAWWRERVLPLLTASLTDVRDALDKKLTRRENTFGSEAIGITFTTAAAVAVTLVPEAVSVKLPSPPFMMSRPGGSLNSCRNPVAPLDEPSLAPRLIVPEKSMRVRWMEIQR